MQRRYIKAALSLLILGLTITAFVYYFTNNPEVGRSLGDTAPELLALLIVMYLLFVGTISLILNATLRLCEVELGRKESVHLTMYSSIVNFFGPLQSGPAFRAAYLKKKHNVSLKRYGLGTLAYYFVYGVINVTLVLFGVIGWWSLLFLALMLLVLYLMRSNARINSLRVKSIGYLAAATLIQVAMITLIFFVELNSLDSTISLSQTLIYTGAANLALFVSLTPGAIGFRESFIFFTQNLHNIESSTIVAANILDRSVYVSILLALAVYLFVSHTGHKLAAVVKSD